MAPGIEARMLVLLNRLQDLERITTLITETAVNGIYSEDQNIALAEALSLLPAVRAAELLQCIISRNAARLPTACNDLLIRCAAMPALSGRIDLAASARHVLDALPDDAAQASQPPYRQRYSRIERK